MTIKVVLLGEDYVGKSTLAHQARSDLPPPTDMTATVGVDNTVKVFPLNDDSSSLLRLIIMDTAGQSRFLKVLLSYVSTAHAIVLLYSWNDQLSLSGVVQSWKNYFQKQIHHSPKIYLVGTKYDLKIQKKDHPNPQSQIPPFTFEDIQKIAKDINATPLETSALAGWNCQQLFQLIASDFVSEIPKPQISSPIPFQKIHKKILCGKVLPVSQILQKMTPTEIHECTLFGWSLLHFAAFVGNVQIAAELLKVGVDMHKKCDSGYTALHLAIIHQHPQIVQLILEEDAKVWKIRSLKDLTIIYLYDHMIRKGKKIQVPDVVKNVVYNRLLSGEANHSLFGKYHPIILACSYSNHQALDLLITHGASPHVTHPDTHRTALHSIKTSEHVKLLVDHGIDLNSQENEKFNTALHLACKGNLDVVVALLEARADVEMVNVDGETPLFMAVKSNSGEVVEKLVEYGADVMKLDKMGHTLLHVSIESGSLSLITKLISTKIPITTKDSNGQTVFDYIDSLGTSKRKAQLYALFSSLNNKSPNMEELVTTFQNIISQ